MLVRSVDPFDSADMFVAILEAEVQLLSLCANL